MINQVINDLLDIVDTNPFPSADTSSHWVKYGKQVVAERRGDRLFLQDNGFGGMKAPGHRTLQLIERITYWRATKPIKNYQSVYKIATKLVSDLSFDMTFDAWKQVVALATLKDHWSGFNIKPKTFALIGDGHGFFGALVHRVFPESYIYQIDLPKMLLFQANTHSVASPNSSMSIMSAQQDRTNITFVQPRDVELIPDAIDCGVNMASMQEMNRTSIESYFKFLRRRSEPSSRFFCINRENKELPDGETTTFIDYPWSSNDEVFIDGRCPFYTHFLGRTQPNGPRVLGRRVPFINYFDGPIAHRLCHLDPSSR